MSPLPVVIPLKPNKNWDDAKYRFISFVMLGVIGSMFVLLLLYPVLGIGAVTSLGSQLGKYTTQIVNITTGQTMEAVNTVGSLVNGLGSGAVTTITTLTAQAMLAIEVVGSALQGLNGLMGGPVKDMLTGAPMEVIKLFQMATNYMGSLFSDITGVTMEVVNTMMEKAFPILGSISEALNFFITNAFGPALRTLNGIRSNLADKIEAFTKSELPRLLDAFRILQTSSQSIIFENNGIALITLTVALFTKGFKSITSTLTNSSIVEDLVSTVVSAIGSITVDLTGLSFSFCDVVVGLIEPAFSLLSIPGVIDLNQCSLEFIKLGIWYMTNGSFCASTTPVTNFTDCLFGEIADIVLVPGQSISFSASYVMDQIGGGAPGWVEDVFEFLIGEMFSLIGGLPRVSLGWNDISLNTVFTNLQTVLVTIFTGMKTIFNVPGGGGTLVSLMPTSINGNTPVLLPLILLYTIYKIIYKFFTEINTIMDSFIGSALDIIDDWTGEVGSGDICFGVDPFEICFDGITIDISDFFSLSSAFSWVSGQLNSFVDSFFNLSTIIANIIGSIPGTPSIPGLDAFIDSALATLNFSVPSGTVYGSF